MCARNDRPHWWCFDPVDRSKNEMHIIYWYGNAARISIAENADAREICDNYSYFDLKAYDANYWYNSPPIQSTEELELEWKPDLMFLCSWRMLNWFQCKNVIQNLMQMRMCCMNVTLFICICTNPARTKKQHMHANDEHRLFGSYFSLSELECSAYPSVVRLLGSAINISQK